MRALRVAGLGADDRTIILETVAQHAGGRREQFTLAVDDNLHAAIRGDLPRVGQIEIEPEHQIRPREIQSRIRAGASVEQVATAAGASRERIERFAYPVLLERSRLAQLAQQAHPVRADGPDVRTLEAVVAETFRERGHDAAAVSWDAWRGEDGKWVIQLHWRTGRSENRAHWTFHPGAHGGTVTAIDDHATALIDPHPATPLRTVPPSPETPSPETPAPKTPAPKTPAPETPAPGTPHPSRGAARSRKDRAPIPSWEDVLLGVRSPRA